jgi:hypothetical protein
MTLGDLWSGRIFGIREPILHNHVFKLDAASYRGRQLGFFRAVVVLSTGGDRSQRANTCPSSPKALNSSALPLGSKKNMVACSPT